MLLSSQTRVLIADDHEVLLERVLSVLRSFQVIGKVNNGKDLVAEALRLRPDVIVSDITMPILNGIEAAHELREAGSASRFVFLTVHDQPAFLDACFAEGALGYVTKSRLGMDLIPAIHEALSGRPFISPSIPR
ncbi:MAG TPA: response regulator transcription factor [Terriglobales bacterium]|nr:response regulator transcription factor [Terriglobales bacterium]